MKQGAMKKRASVQGLSATPRPSVTEAAQLLADSQPRYVSVATALAAEILDGRLAVDEKLPTEHELCRTFGVSRSTVRQALQRLRDLGLVAGTQGVGTRVIADQPRSNFQLAVRSVADVMSYADHTRLDIRERGMVQADAALAGRIGCAAGSRWARIRGLRLPQDPKALPISWIELYVAEEFAAMTERPDFATVPAYRLIGRHMGVAVASVQQEITAVPLTAEHAAALQTLPGSPGLQIERRFFAADGRLIEATTNIHGAANRFAYTMRLGAPDQV